MRTRKKPDTLAALALLLGLLTAGAGGVDLYPYGLSQSDAQLSRGDEETSSVFLSTPFVFYRQEHTDITVSPNVRSGQADSVLFSRRCCHN